MNRFTSVWAKLFALAAIGIALMLATRAVNAAEIVEVKTESGITAWLKQEPSIPIIALDALWTGAGGASEPVDKAGLTNLLAAMLDEGAGDLDSQAFQRTLEDQAVRLSFEATRDNFSMSLQTLSDKSEEGFRLAGLALSSPRFDAEPLERMRAGILNGISRDSRNPNSIAGREFTAMIFPGDRYGVPQDGTQESVTALTADDLRAHKDRLIARDNLIIGVVGDISPEALKPLLEAAFGGLPAKAEVGPVDDIEPVMNGQLRIIEHDSPQTVYVFGLPGLKRDDPDFDIARVMNHMLGGGGFSSLLTEEIREKRGLTYGVYSYLRPMDRTGLWLGGLATSNEKAAEALTVLKQTIADYRDNGPSEEDLEKAKANINGAFPLRFTSNSRLAQLLTAIQRYDLGSDYMQTRPEAISAVTVDDIRRVAQRLLDLEKLAVMAVGRPTGLDATSTQ